MYKKFKLYFFCIIFITLISHSIYATVSDIEKSGDILQILIPTAGFTSTIFYEKGHEGTIQFLKSLAISQTITQSLKLSVSKTRPNGDDNKSFPSGHSSAAFMGASFIHNRYGFKYSIPAYLGATFVGYSRVYAKKHYIEDVAFGAAISITTNYYITKPYKGLNVTPTAGNGYYGIILSKNW